MRKGTLLCRCSYIDCDKGYISKRLSIALEEFEYLIPGYDIVIHSGYRCPRWNEHEGGSTLSKHMIGDAVDFRVPGLTVPEMVQVAERVEYFNNGGIGAYLNDYEPEAFIHCDVRRGKARWLHDHWKKQTYKQMEATGIFTL